MPAPYLLDGRTRDIASTGHSTGLNDPLSLFIPAASHDNRRALRTAGKFLTVVKKMIDFFDDEYNQ